MSETKALDAWAQEGGRGVLLEHSRAGWVASAVAFGDGGAMAYVTCGDDPEGDNGRSETKARALEVLNDAIASEAARVLGSE